MDDLGKIDIIRERLDVSYKEAKDALDQAEGDVVQALIKLEQGNKRWDDKLDDAGKKISEYIRDIVKKGNVTKVRLKKGDKVIIEIPATIGALGVGGALLSTPLAIIGVVGTVAALINNYKLEIVRPDGRVEEHDLKFLINDDENRNQD
jgi:N-acetylmuramic acid 6-phosphate (MurNAc-6-P) etherase